MLVLGDEIEKLKPSRAGIIPYVKIDDEIYFLVGIDKSSGEFGDLGGGVKQGETPITGSLREMTEETKELLNVNDLGEIKIGIWDKGNNNCIVFSQLKDAQLYYTIENDFKNCTKKGIGFEEMSFLIWLSSDQMIYNIYSKNSKMWSRMKYTLGNGAVFDDKLLAML